MMEFKEAIVETVKNAKKFNRRMYMYWSKQDGCFMVSPTYWSDWLFQAYPGGRTILSMDGKKLLEE